LKTTTDSRLVLAPFKGLTNKVYRNAFANHFGGFEEYYAPFVSGVGTGRINPSKLKDVLPRAENVAPVVPQFISTDAREIILLAETLHEHGYGHINWNLGCPFARIAEKYRGCGILPYPEMLDRLLGEIFANGIPLKLSIKTRLGYKQPEEIRQVLPVLNNYPIHHIIMHARTGKQVYRGEVNAAAFAECLSMSKHPLIYNGDVYTLSRYHAFRAMFPETVTWMLGRGALMNPFLAMEIKGITFAEDQKRKTIAAFHQELYTNAELPIPQEKKHLGWMKAVWYYMAGLFAGGEEVFSRIKKAPNQDAYRNAVSYALQRPFAADAELESYFRHSIKHTGS